MPIENINQPEIINIDSNLRLRKFEWYQDEDIRFIGI